MITRLLLSLILLSCAYAQADDTNIETYFSNFEALNNIYAEFENTTEIENMLINGKVDEVNQRLISLIPDSKKTALDNFILGNMLYEIDPQASYHFMLKAEKEDANNPFILFERGLHEHRLGNYSLAQAYYERTSKFPITSKNHILFAYLTHTYLMTGQADKAFEAWEKADFREHHTSIEKAMYSVFSDNNQEKKRSELLSDIRNGQVYKLCDLYQLDAQWEIDWWNYKPKKEYVQFDKNLADITLKQPIDKEHFGLCTDENLSDEAFIERLTAIGFFEKNASLPKSARLIHKVLGRLLKTNKMSLEEFIQKHESQLIDLSKAAPKNRKYYDVLAVLYERTENTEKLESINRYGWKVLKLENYARSYIAHLKPKSTEYYTNLDEALVDFPLSPILNGYRLSDDSYNKKEALLKFVASQFTNVKNNWMGPHRLNDYMASLKFELEKLDGAK